jgi:hypothetical protein
MVEKLPRSPQKVLFGRMFLCLFWLCSSVYEPLLLTDDTFEDQLRQAPLSFVIASQSNISFCQDLLPKFRAVAEILKDKCQFVILEHDPSPKIREKYGIFAVPSLFVFRRDILTAEYTGERESTPILNFVRRITGPRVKPLDTARETYDFLRETHAALVLAGDEVDESVSTVFAKVAENLSDLVPFVTAATPESLQHLGLEDGTFLQLHRLDDRKVIEFPLEDGLTEDGLREWVLANRHPRYFAKNPVIFRDLAFNTRFTLLAFADFIRKVSTDAVHAALGRVFEEYGDALALVYLDSVENAGILGALGFSGQRDPVYSIVRFTGGEIREKWPYPEHMLSTPENIVRFVGRFLNMTREANMKSEAVVGNQTGPLFKLVGREFSAATGDAKFDVVTAILVGSEENRSVTLERMNATAMELQKQKVKTVKCYYIDMELNDLPGLQVGNWTSPVVLLWPAGTEKSCLLFEADLSVAELLDAIKTNGKSKFKITVPKEKGKRKKNDDL